jgi:glutaryl-CoA dehydrogenase
MTDDDLGAALGTDFFLVREQFTDEQWERFLTTRRFVDSEAAGAADYWERAEPRLAADPDGSPSSASSGRASRATARPR